MDHESASKMSDEEADYGDADEGDTVLDHVMIKPAENGGYIVTCDRRRVEENQEMGHAAMGPPTMGSYLGPKDYVFTSQQKLFAYLKQELGS